MKCPIHLRKMPRVSVENVWRERVIRKVTLNGKTYSLTNLIKKPPARDFTDPIAVHEILSKAEIRQHSKMKVIDNEISLDRSKLLYEHSGKEWSDIARECLDDDELEDIIINY